MILEKFIPRPIAAALSVPRIRTQRLRDEARNSNAREKPVIGRTAMAVIRKFFFVQAKEAGCADLRWST
jgi:hypothetical protein